MGDNTTIEWARHPETGRGATWNPITGCALVSEGCRNCFAADLAATRLKNHPSRAGLARMNAAGVAKFTGEVRFNDKWLDQPLRWRTPRGIFVCAHGDLFAEGVRDNWIDRVFAVMALSPRHTFQVLTKRPARMKAYLTGSATVRRIYTEACDLVTVDQVADVVLIAPGVDPALAPEGTRIHLDTWPLPNVWLGVSAEDQATADERIPLLLDTPAAVRFLSAEPLLGPMDLTHIDDGTAHREVPRAAWGPLDDEDSPPGLWWDALTGERTIVHGGADGWWRRTDEALDWVIAGGESGRNARPMHPDWARSLRDQCQAAEVPFFFKQWGEYRPSMSGRALAPDGSSPPPARWNEPTTAWMDRVGKKTAGRLLDGRTHDAMPAPSRPAARGGAPSPVAPSLANSMGDA